MIIKQELLDKGFVVKLETLEEVRELSIVLDSLGYKWWSGKNLIQHDFFGRSLGTLAYYMEPDWKGGHVSYNGVVTFEEQGLVVYNYKEIYEYKYLYKEV
jgi:hypothetical protein